MLVHLSDNKLNSYRSKEDFFVGQYKEKVARSFLGDKKQRSTTEVLERQY